MVSKPQIMFESKAQADEKAQHTLKYVSILKRRATQLSDIRWGFQTTSINKPHFRGIGVGFCFVHACRAKEFGPFPGVIELLIHAKENHHP